MLLLLLIGEKGQSLCYVSNKHGSFYRISHYFRINFNSFMRKTPKVERTCASKIQHNHQQVNSLFHRKDFKALDSSRILA